MRVSPLIISLLLILLFACKEQELPEEFTGTPDFFLTGDLGSTQLDLKAGIDGYFMHTGYEYDDKNIAIFWGEFAPATCSDCPERLRIEIRDFQTTTPGGPVDIDQALVTGSYDYLQERDRRIFRVSFSSETNSDPNTGYEWDFGDGESSTAANPQHTYFIDSIISLNSYDVCLETTDADGCVNVICNEVSLEPPACKAAFTHEVSSQYPNYVIFRSESEGALPLTYKWDFGDGFSASLGNPGYYYGNTGLFTACLTVTDANGCTSVICKNVAVDPSLCETNFSYVVEEFVTSPEDTLAFSKVRVLWVDAQGQEWSSSALAQPESSFFELVSSEDYADNLGGEKVKRLKLEWECLLFHENDTLHLKQGNGFVGVAYP